MVKERNREKVRLDSGIYTDCMGRAAKATESRSRESYIPTLDGVRAVAIVLVVVSHALPQENAYRELMGHVGVLLFFALSGYLITTKLLEEHRQRGAINLRAFYLRRAFRILPPAFTYLTILSILSAIGWMACDARSIIAALFFYINYIPVTIVAWKAGHFWSLSVEEHFYLIWPALLIMFGVMRGWRTAAMLAIVVCVWRSAGFNWHWLFHTDYIADTLLWGCCLAFVPARRIRFPTMLTIGLFSLFGLVEFGPFHGRLMLLLSHLIPAVILGVIVMSPATVVGQLLELSPVRYLGRLSYSLYIWQQMFLGGRANHLPWWAGIVCAVLAAYLSYRLIERPSIAYGHRLISKQSDAKLAALQRHVATDG